MTPALALAPKFLKFSARWYMLPIAALVWSLHETTSSVVLAPEAPPTRHHEGVKVRTFMMRGERHMGTNPGCTWCPHRRPPSCHRALALGYGSAPAAEASFSACYEPQEVAVMP